MLPVILLNYNSAADCRKCISFLERQKGVELQIVVVDNCSRDEDRREAEKLCRDGGCTFLAAAENRGYAAGNNIGLRHAAALGAEYALVINPDMELPEPTYLERMLARMRTDERIAVLGTDIVKADGMQHQNPMIADSNLRDFFWFIGLLKSALRWGEEQSCTGDYTRSGYCSKLSGCCLLLRISFLEQIGFLDEGTFLYCEEPILAAQVRQAGQKMYYMADASAFHRHIKSEKGDANARIRLFFKSRTYYLRKYSGLSGIRLAALLLSIKAQSLFYRFIRL